MLCNFITSEAAFYGLWQMKISITHYLKKNRDAVCLILRTDNISGNFTFHAQRNYLVEFLQNDFLKVIVIHFLADRVEVVLQNRDVQAEVKLRLVIAKGEGRVTNCHLGDVAHSATLRIIGQREKMSLCHSIKHAQTLASVVKHTVSAATMKKNTLFHSASFSFTCSSFCLESADLFKERLELPLLCPFFPQLSHEGLKEPFLCFLQQQKKHSRDCFFFNGKWI